MAVHHYGTGDYSQCRQLTATAVGMFDNLLHADTGQEVPASDNNHSMNGYLSLDNAGPISADAFTTSFAPKNRDYKQLYWSLFTWDRLSSLCLNRHPFLRRRDIGPPGEWPALSREVSSKCVQMARTSNICGSQCCRLSKGSSACRCHCILQWRLVRRPALLSRCMAYAATGKV